MHSAHGVSSSMSWLNYFGIFVLSFSFIDLPNGVSLAFLVGCLGCVILEYVFLQLLALYVCMVACLFLCLRHGLPARCFGEPFFILLCVSFQSVHLSSTLCPLLPARPNKRGTKKHDICGAGLTSCLGSMPFLHFLLLSSVLSFLAILGGSETTFLPKLLEVTIIFLGEMKVISKL